MKSREIVFKRPFKVFQVFRKIHLYGKSEMAIPGNKDKVDWGAIPSKSGHTFENELYLPESILSQGDLLTCDLILLTDDIVPTSTSETPAQRKAVNSVEKTEQIRCFNLSRNCQFDIFKIKKKEGIELHLKYGHFDIGIPKREDFKLGELKAGKPLEIKINGKTDFSLTSRRARIFKELTYIFNYVGEFRKCKILKEPFGFTVKPIPGNRKVVNLIKPLW